MPQVLHSVWKVVQNEVVLLDYDDYIEDTFDLEPTDETQVAGYSGGEGARTFARGNDMHTISFVRWRVYDSGLKAAAGQIAEAIAIGALGSADVQIRVSGHTGYASLYAAKVVAWPSKVVECCFVRTAFTILGGALTDTMALTGVVRTITDQGGGGIVDQGGGVVVDQG